MKFLYGGDVLDGFDHAYNTTARNERAVEIAIALQFLGWVSGAGLEVGNVLSHYGVSRRRRVVDLYEKAPDVDNVDVFDIEGSFDWIVSISTVEHVQWDTAPRDPTGAIRAINHLVSLLSTDGRMLVTVPGGYNSPLDEYLATGAGATRDCTYVRDGDGWQRTSERHFWPYGHTTPWAESVWVGEWEG